MGRTTRNANRPGFVSDWNSVSQNGGRTVDWDDVPASRENADGDKEIPAGMPMSFAEHGLIPRPDTEFSISNLTASSGTVTATTASDHNYEVGDVVTISGTSNYDGTFEVTAVPASDQFEYDLGSTPADESTGTVVIEAKGILLTNAIDGEETHSLSGYGLVVGGVIYENLLPIQLSDTLKSELQDHGTGFVFEVYFDSRMGGGGGGISL